MILYRPVGLQELELIYDSGMKAFPARLPQQPIFYPVLDLEYARQTASEWNAKNGQFAGYVSQFKVEDDYINQFETHLVGASQHQEFWIQAEEVEEFNRHISGHIKILEAYFGREFQGFVPEKFGLQGKNAVAQFTELANIFVYKRMDFYLEIKRNHKAIFLNYPFWLKHEFKNQGLKEKVLQAIKEAWLTSFPQIPLANPVPQESPSDKQANARSFAHPIEEKAGPEEKPISRFVVHPVDEDTTPEEPPEPGSEVHPTREDPKPEEKPRSRFTVHPGDEDTKPEKKSDSRFMIRPRGEHARPVKQTNSRSSVNPVRVEKPASVGRPESHFAQGIKLGLSEKYREAVEELFKAVEEERENIIARTSLGVAYHRLGEEDRALSCYQAALKINSKHAEAHYFRANILYAKGEVREAMAGYTLAIGLDPELIEAHQKPAPQDRLTDYTHFPVEMHRIARPAHRILDLNTSIKTNPQQAYLFKERAAEYCRLLNYEQAIADYSASLEIQPDDAHALHLRGNAYEQLRQSERAVEDYERAMAIDPQLSDVYNDRGVNFGKMGNFQQSVRSLTEGIRLAPRKPDGYFNRGMTYLQLNDFESAIDDFSRVIQLSSNDEAAYYWRGMSYEETGRQGEAIADYKQFLTLSQDPRTKAEIEQKLRQWDEEKRTAGGSQRADPGNRQKQDQPLDLYDLLTALGERALRSTWFGSNVNCDGEKAEELYRLTDRNQPIEGDDLLRLTSGIRKTVEGDFQAFDAGAASPWFFIRAWEGSGFYIETNDRKTKQRLKAHLPSVEEVEGAAPPYEGLFIHI